MFYQIRKFLNVFGSGCFRRMMLGSFQEGLQIFDFLAVLIHFLQFLNLKIFIQWLGVQIGSVCHISDILPQCYSLNFLNLTHFSILYDMSLYMASLDEKQPGVMCEECFGLSIDLFTFINLGHNVYHARGPYSILPSMLIHYDNYGNFHVILGNFL